MKFINLTPHEIHEVYTDQRIPSTGLARIDMVSTEVDKYDNVPIYRSEYKGSLQGLPEPKEGVIYIVSALALNAVPSYRNDVVAPGSLVRDKDGNPNGCRGFRIR